MRRLLFGVPLLWEIGHNAVLGLTAAGHSWPEMPRVSACCAAEPLVSSARGSTRCLVANVAAVPIQQPDARGSGKGSRRWSVQLAQQVMDRAHSLQELPLPGRPTNKGVKVSFVTAPGATFYERWRDATMRLLSLHIFTKLVVVWLVALVGSFVWFALHLLDLLGMAEDDNNYWLEKSTQVRQPAQLGTGMRGPCSTRPSRPTHSADEHHDGTTTIAHSAAAYPQQMSYSHPFTVHTSDP